LIGEAMRVVRGLQGWADYLLGRRRLKPIDTYILKHR
jgi:hypothetical protein